jgi:hypothetical protein
MRIILRFVQRSVVFVRVPTQSKESVAQHIKSGGLQTRELTSELNACLSIFNSKIHRPTTYRIVLKAPSTGTGCYHRNAKILQILYGIRN